MESEDRLQESRMVTIAKKTMRGRSKVHDDSRVVSATLCEVLVFSQEVAADDTWQAMRYAEALPNDVM